MHQPVHNLTEDELELSWVRLHCTKSYLTWHGCSAGTLKSGVRSISSRYFLEQIQVYLDGMRDRFFGFAMKPTSELTLGEKLILGTLSCSYDRAVVRHARATKRFMKWHTNRTRLAGCLRKITAISSSSFFT